MYESSSICVELFMNMVEHHVALIYNIDYV